jgi:hypothetical protein
MLSRKIQKNTSEPSGGTIKGFIYKNPMCNMTLDQSHQSKNEWTILDNTMMKAQEALISTIEKNRKGALATFQKVGKSVVSEIQRKISKI